MSSRRHKSHKRDRSRSPSSRRNSAPSAEDQNDHSPPKRRKEDDSLQEILNSIEILSKRLDSLASRSLQREIIPSVSDVHEDDTLSIMADMSGLDSSPPRMPNAAPVEPIQAPVEPIKATVEPTEAPSESSKTQEDAAHLQCASDDHGLFHPVARSTSWTSSASFSKFLDTNFRRKLSYQQSLVIPDDWAIPEVNALQAHKLDQQLLNQVPLKVKSSSKKGTKKSL